MALKDIIKLEDSFISRGGISPTTGNLNGSYRPGKIGQGFQIARAGGGLIYAPSDFGVDLNSNKWGFTIWCEASLNSLDTVDARHELMNIGTYYDPSESDIRLGFHSGIGQRSISVGVYENLVAKTGLGSDIWTDWEYGNWILHGLFCDGTQFHWWRWEQNDGFESSSADISWDASTYPFQDSLIVGGYDWDHDSWGGGIDEVRIYDDAISKKEFLEIAKGKEYHYKFNTYAETQENEFYDNWDSLVPGAYATSVHQPGAYDPFGMTTDNSVFRCTGKTRFGNSIGTDIGTLYNGNTYTFSIYLKHVYDEPIMGSGEFDIVDRTGARSFSGSLGDNMNYTWKRFWTTALHDNSSSYHFIDIGTFSGTNVFDWCCPQIVEEVGVIAPPEQIITPFTTGEIGTVQDNSGNGNDVTLSYSDSPHWEQDASTEDRKCYRWVADSTKRIIVPSDPLCRTQTMTMCCWAYQLDTSTQAGTGSTTIQHIISQGRDGVTYGAHIYTSSGAVYGRYGTGSYNISLGTGASLLTGWHHLALVYDNSVGGAFYVDGVLNESNSLMGSNNNINYNNYDFTIGKMAHGNTGATTYFPFNGYIDDVRVYSSALSQDDITEIYQQKASIDSNGNFSTGDLLETGHVPLILDYTTWAVGSGGATGFTLNGGTAENERILSGDPWGNQDAIVWEARPGAVSDADGGWNSSTFNIDNSYFYRYSQWVWRNSNSDGNSYMGCHGYGSVAGVYDRSSGVNVTNPYFYTSELVPTAGRWELVVGHIWPAGSGTGSMHSESGRYTIEDGYIGTSDWNDDYVWRSESSSANQRSYLYYSIDTSIRKQWIYPRVDKIDGTEPSIEDLLGGFDAAHYDYINTKGGSEYINLDVGKQSTNVGHLSEVGPTYELINWYPFDGSTTDLVTGTHGILTGTFTSEAGLDQPAYRFTDETTYVTLPATLTDSSTCSFSFWLKEDAVQGWLPFVGQTTSYYFMATSGGTGAFYHSNVGSATVIYVDGEVATAPDGDTAWHNYIITGLDLRTWTLLKASGYSSAWAIDGLMQDVRIYDRILTAEEAKILSKMHNTTNRTQLTKDTLYVKGEIKEN